MSEELRIEIHEAQNVVERLNSVMGFIFSCMAYINTIIFQKVLSKPEWQNVLLPEDKRALNVLFHSHINPYGLFPLDLTKRLGITADELEMENYNEDEDAMTDEVYDKSA